MHAGGNRGRGQITPEGIKTNNNLYTASASGTISKIAKEEDEDGNVKFVVSIKAESGEVATETILAQDK